MKNRLTPALAGCAVLLLVLLAPSAVGSSSAAARGKPHGGQLPLGDAQRGDHLQRLSAGRLRRLDQALPRPLPPARARRLEERLDADEGHARRADRRGRDPADDRDHARRAVEQPRELLRRLRLHRRRPGPPGRDRVHAGPDRARRLDVPDGRRPHRPRRRRLLDGRLRRHALLARAPRSVRRRRSCSARPSTSRCRRRTPARASSARSARATSLFVEKIYQELNYPAVFPSFSATGLTLPMFIAVGDDEFKNPNPKDCIHDLDFEAHVLFNQAVRVPNMTAELRVVDGGHDWDVWGPEFVEGAKYIFRFLDQAPATPMKASADRYGRRGAGGRRRGRRGGQRLPGARRRRARSQASRTSGDKDLVLVKDSPTGTRLWTRELGNGADRAGVRRRDRPGGRRGRHRLHDRRPRRRPRRQHDRRRLRRQVRPRRQREVAAPVRRSRPLPTAATRSRRTRREHLRHRLHPRQPRRGEPSATRTSTSPSSTRAARSSGCSSSAARARTRRWGVAATGDGIRVGGMTVGRARHAGRRPRRLGRPLRRRRQPRLAAAVRHGRQRGGLGADGRRRRQHVRRRLLGGRLRRPARRRQGHRRREVRRGRDDDLGRPARHRPERQGCRGRARRRRQPLRRRLQRRQRRHEHRQVRRACSSSTRPTRPASGCGSSARPEDDGADAFAEANLYLATHGGSIYVSGLTLGDVEGQTQLGLGDVFLARFNALGENG